MMGGMGASISPVVAGNLAIIAAGNIVTAVSTENGARVWQLKGESPLSGRGVVADGVYYYNTGSAATDGDNKDKPAKDVAGLHALKVK